MRRIAITAVVLAIAGCGSADLPRPLVAAGPPAPAPAVGVDVLSAFALDGVTPLRWETKNVSLSADGGRLLFATTDVGLVPGGSLDPGVPQIIRAYVRDLSTGAVWRASESAKGVSTDRDVLRATMSADGMVVAFDSDSPLLIPGVHQSGPFVKNLHTGTITFAATNADGILANAPAHHPSLSADGSTIAFLSDADNLVPGDTNRALDAFVKNLRTGAVTRVSVAADGTQPQVDLDNADVPANGGVRALIGDLTLASDGSTVAFSSSAPGLVPGDDNHRTDVFVRDLRTGTLRRFAGAASPATSGETSCPSLSADGRTVAFQFDEQPYYLHGKAVHATQVADTITGGLRTLVVADERNAVDGIINCPTLSGDGAHVGLTHFLARPAGSSRDTPDQCAEVRDVVTGRIELAVPCPVRDNRVALSGNGDRLAWSGGAQYPNEPTHASPYVRRLR